VGGADPLRSACLWCSLHHRDPAAQRHRLAAHGPCAQQHAAGHSVRFERMRGKDVLWQPGTDHAGIATQMVVERKLAPRGRSRPPHLGREAFLESVWEWKDESGGTITSTSCAARRLLRLVARALHHGRGAVEGRARGLRRALPEGLIYKDKRLVNWDPKLLTAISDLEVEQIEVKGNLWHLRYPIEGERSRAASSRSRPRGRRRCWATPALPCIPRRALST
jgi:valyl-tRNA synthetase